MLRYLTHIRDWYRNPFRNRPNWAEIIILCLTIAIALIYFGQLREMHGAGQQTADLVKYAEAQACAARKIADASNRNAQAAEKAATAAANFATSADQIRQETANAVGELKRAANDSETAMRENSRNAQNALNTSIEASKLDQRPWFGISQFKILKYDPDDPKQPFRMEIEFKNTGKTPARQIHVFGVFGIHDSRAEGPKDDEWKSFLTSYAQEAGRFVAAPNAPRGYIVGDFGQGPENQLFRSLFTQNFAAIRNSSKFLSYFGQAAYIDTDNRPHTTKFCLVLADIETKQLAHCGRGNDMD